MQDSAPHNVTASSYSFADQNDTGRTSIPTTPTVGSCVSRSEETRKSDTLKLKDNSVLYNQRIEFGRSDDSVTSTHYTFGKLKAGTISSIPKTTQQSTSRRDKGGTAPAPVVPEIRGRKTKSREVHLPSSSSDKSRAVKRTKYSHPTPVEKNHDKDSEAEEERGLEVKKENPFQWNFENLSYDFGLGIAHVQLYRNSFLKLCRIYRPGNTPTSRHIAISMIKCVKEFDSEGLLGVGCIINVTCGCDCCTGTTASPGKSTGTSNKPNYHYGRFPPSSSTEANEVRGVQKGKFQLDAYSEESSRGEQSSSSSLGTESISDEDISPLSITPTTTYYSSPSSSSSKSPLEAFCSHCPYRRKLGYLSYPTRQTHRREVSQEVRAAHYSASTLNYYDVNPLYMVIGDHMEFPAPNLSKFLEVYGALPHYCTDGIHLLMTRRRDRKITFILCPEFAIKEFTNMPEHAYTTPKNTSLTSKAARMNALPDSLNVIPTVHKFAPSLEVGITGSGVGDPKHIITFGDFSPKHLWAIDKKRTLNNTTFVYVKESVFKIEIPGNRRFVLIPKNSWRIGNPELFHMKQMGQFTSLFKSPSRSGELYEGDRKKEEVHIQTVEMEKEEVIQESAHTHHRHRGRKRRTLELTTSQTTGSKGEINIDNVEEGMMMGGEEESERQRTHLPQEGPPKKKKKGEKEEGEEEEAKILKEILLRMTSLETDLKAAKEEIFRAKGEIEKERHTCERLLKVIMGVSEGSKIMGNPRECADLPVISDNIISHSPSPPTTPISSPGRDLPDLPFPHTDDGEVREQLEEEGPQGEIIATQNHNSKTNITLEEESMLSKCETKTTEVPSQPSIPPTTRGRTPSKKIVVSLHNLSRINESSTSTTSLPSAMKPTSTPKLTVRIQNQTPSRSNINKSGHK